MNISKKKSLCLDAKGVVDHYSGHFKCPDCGENTETFYFDDRRRSNLQYCEKCDTYYPF